MSQILSSLKIDEVSFVDSPACAEIDPLTGRKIKRATVALFKRDTSAHDHDYKSNQSNQQEKPMQFEQILKSATTRDQIVEAVRKRAEADAVQKGCSAEAAEAKIWKSHPEAYEAYESAPKSAPKRPQPKMIQATEAEAILDSRARKIMKSNPGVNYPHACSQVLQEDPALYTRYEQELAAGNTYEVPDPAQSLDDRMPPMDYAIKRGKEAAEDGVCPACDAEVSSSATYCSDCGAKLAKSKSKAKA